jgi:16S rRNA (cytidine1402-2'-O)-methyltransferase
MQAPPTPSLPPLTAGTLYLVATPIGNLEDITLRALRVLRECDVVAAEDTRRTGQLLRHFEISRPLLSYHHFNEARRSEQILERLQAGGKVALVTDAGSPGISDPGERVVRAALAAGLRVESVPGPCALIAALTASGLATGEFHFLGFLPHKSGQRRKQLEALRTVPGTLVLYESPWRVEKLLAELAEVFPEREVVLARELTKKFEEFRRGKPTQLLAAARSRPLKGEFVVMIGGAVGELARPTATLGELPGTGQASRLSPTEAEPEKPVSDTTPDLP